MNGLKKEVVTWTQILDSLPLLALVAAVIFSFSTLIIKNAVIESKLDNTIALLNKYMERQNILEQRIVVIETEHEMNRR